PTLVPYTTLFRSHLNNVVQIAPFEQVKSSQLLFGFSEGAVGYIRLAITHPYGGGGIDWLQCVASQKVAGAAQVVSAINAFLVKRLPFLLWHGVDDLLVVINQTKIFHKLVPYFQMKITCSL